MTVCLGTICENGTSVIVASDRMWTQKYLSVEFEYGEPKIDNIGECCVLTTAGSVIAPTELIENSKSDIEKKKISEISKISEVVKEHLTLERSKRIEDKYFKPRGITIEEFYRSGMQSQILSDIVTRLDNLIEMYEFELEILIAGIDEKGGHLYVVFPPGRVESMDRVGYVSIGSGTPHAESTFILNDFRRDWDIKKALYVTYEAKKLAEKAPGVGKKTDIVIMNKNNKPRALKESTFKQLQSIFDKKTKTKGLEDEEIKNKINDLSIWEGEK